MNACTLSTGIYTRLVSEKGNKIVTHLSQPPNCVTHLSPTQNSLFRSALGIGPAIVTQFIKPLPVLDFSVIVCVCVLHKGVHFVLH